MRLTLLLDADGRTLFDGALPVDNEHFVFLEVPRGDEWEVVRFARRPSFDRDGRFAYMETLPGD